MRKTYQEKLKEFAALGPFRFVDIIQFHGGDEAVKPRCAACGSKQPYGFWVVVDRLGTQHYLGRRCASKLLSKEKGA